jgi:hypothetical protein
MAFAWVIRPPLLVAISCVFIFLWTLTFASLPIFGFWMADKQLVQGMVNGARDKGLIPKENEQNRPAGQRK